MKMSVTDVQVHLWESEHPQRKIRLRIGAALGVHRGMGISSPHSNLGTVIGMICSSNWAHCVEEEDSMSRRVGNFTGGALAGAVYLAVSLSVSAMAAGVSPPDLAPNPSVGWFAYAREFIPPASGAGPVRQDPAHPHVSNDDFRVTGRQPTFPVGDQQSHSPAMGERQDPQAQ